MDSISVFDNSYQLIEYNQVEYNFYTRNLKDALNTNLSLTYNIYKKTSLLIVRFLINLLKEKDLLKLY